MMNRLMLLFRRHCWVLLFFFVVTTAYAQTPRPLGSPDSSSRGPVVSSEEARPFRAPIDVNELQGIDLNRIGTLSPDEGGFGADLWQSMRYEGVLRGLERLPVRYEVPAVRSLAIQVLLSAATPPDWGVMASSSQPASDLLQERLEKLMDMGAFEEFQSLQRSIPVRHQDPGLFRYQVLGKLLAEEVEAGCASVSTVLSRGLSPSDPAASFWAQVDIICELAQVRGSGRVQNKRTALFKKRLAEDRGVALPPGFSWLADRLVDTSAPLRPEFSGLTVMEALLIRYATADTQSARLTAGDIQPSLAMATPGALKILAEQTNLSVDVRLPIAHLAERFHVFPTPDLKALALSKILPADRVQGVVADLAIEGFLARMVNERPDWLAVLVQGYEFQRGRDARAAYLQAVLEAAPSFPIYAQLSRLFAEELQGLEPSDELVWFAATAAHSLLTAGDTTTARQWDEVRMRYGQSTGIVQPPLVDLLQARNLEALGRSGVLEAMPASVLGHLYLLTRNNAYLSPAALGDQEMTSAVSQMQMATLPAASLTQFLYYAQNVQAGDQANGAMLLWGLRLIADNNADEEVLPNPFIYNALIYHFDQRDLRPVASALKRWSEMLYTWPMVRPTVGPAVHQNQNTDLRDGR